MAVLKRIAQALLVILLAFTATFILMQALPGDGVLARYQNPELGLTPEQIEELRRVYGVDQPVWVQLLHYYEGLLQGDLGRSLLLGKGVFAATMERLPVTLGLSAEDAMAAMPASNEIWAGLAEHLQVFAALKSGDAGAAKQAMRQHLLAQREALRELARNPPSRIAP